MGEKKSRFRLVKGIFFSLFLWGLILQTTPAALAAGYDYKFDSKPVKIGHFETEMADKFTRGLTNTAFGWTEMARTPATMTEGIEGSFLKSIFLGIPYGLVRGVARTGVGVYEILTFYAPQGPIMESLEGDVR